MMKGPFISEIAYKTYAINDYGMSAMFLLVGTEKAMLIDTGVGLTDIPKTVAALTDLPFITVLTHGHGDHIGGCEQLDEVYLHEADWDMYLNNDVGFLENYIKNMGERGSFDAYDCPKSIRTGRKVKLLPLDDDQVFDLGGRKVKVITTPDHTPGSIVLIDDLSRIMFSGDSCNINLGLTESVHITLDSMMKIKAHQSEFDRNFNGHIGYAGDPTCYSMPESTLDDCIWICEHLIAGDAPVEDVPNNPHHANAGTVVHGPTRINFSKDNI